MRLAFGMVAVAGLVFVACEGFGAETAKSLTPVAVSGGAATIGPDNSRIQFIGTHSGAKPDPRVGGFAKFAGKIQVDPATKSLKAVSVEIDTASIFTPIPMLTDHLKSPDFFEVREHPKAKFESTKIEADKKGQMTITGKLTIRGVTKEISFPATVELGDKGLSLKSEFNLDRTDFGLSFGQGKVENKIAMTVVVGEKTTAK